MMKSALCLTAVLSTTIQSCQGQVQRIRDSAIFVDEQDAKNTNNAQGFGRSYLRNKKRATNRQLKNTNQRKLEMSMSEPSLEPLDFSISMPALTELEYSMSFPSLDELEMSMSDFDESFPEFPLELAEFPIPDSHKSMSMSMSLSMPEEEVPALEEAAIEMSMPDEDMSVSMSMSMSVPALVPAEEAPIGCNGDNYCPSDMYCKCEMFCRFCIFPPCGYCEPNEA